MRGPRRPPPTCHLLHSNPPAGPTRRPTAPPNAILSHPELKEDAKGLKEFQDYRTKLLIQRADLEGRIAKNKAWIVRGARRGARVTPGRGSVNSTPRTNARAPAAQAPSLIACPPPRPIPRPQANFERNSHNGAFEEQYRRLVAEIETIYKGAKEFHAAGCAHSRQRTALPRWPRAALLCAPCSARRAAHREHVSLAPTTPLPPPPPRIDLLIRDFNYHVNFKRWNDTFTAVPFKPK